MPHFHSHFYTDNLAEGMEMAAGVQSTLKVQRL